MTPFGEIMRRAVLATPGAVAGAFADAQGELVDGFFARDAAQPGARTGDDRDSSTRRVAARIGGAEPIDWAIVTAHYGVILAQLRAAYGIWHVGSPEYFIAQHAGLDVVVHAVADGYYALIALAPERLPSAGCAMREAIQADRIAGEDHFAIPALRDAVHALRAEMA